MRLGLLLSVALLAAGCGGNGDTGADTTETTDREGTATVVYFLRDGKVWPVFHEAEASLGEALAAGPNGDASDLGLTTEVPEGVTIDPASGDVESEETLSDGARAQLVYTLTTEPGVKSIEIDGASYTRADFEEQTPSVLVESPLPFQDVSSPLFAGGTANTFEATFSFEILDEGGEVIAGDFATATSGSGTRGKFYFEQPFVVEEEQDGTLRVFELSAEDGSRMNEVDIPVRLLP